MYKELSKRIKQIQKSKKKKVFYFGNTAKKESNNFYLTNIQENNKFIYFGAVIFNNHAAQKIAKLVDGKVDLVLVDTEKKVFSKKKSELINIERSKEGHMTVNYNFLIKLYSELNADQKIKFNKSLQMSGTVISKAV